MKEIIDKKQPDPRQPEGDPRPDNSPLGDPPVEAPPVDETDVPTPAVEALRIDES
jgi:hypothetical protein